MAQAAVEKLAFPDEKKKYIVDTLDPVLHTMVQEVLNKQPPEPVQFMVEWLRLKGNIPPPKKMNKSHTQMNKDLKAELANCQAFLADCSTAGAPEAAKTEKAAEAPKAEEKKEEKEDKKDEDSEEEDDDDDVEDMPPPPPPESRKARQSVSAEAYGAWNLKKEFTPPVFPKTDEQKKVLSDILSKSILFNKLEQKDMDVILAAMQEKSFEAGQLIIKEGDDGDVLYVIEEGSPECKKKIDGVETVVKVCKPGDVFGELALLYNNPRAATVEAVDKCLAWQLDRETFSHIVKGGK